MKDSELIAELTDVIEKHRGDVRADKSYESVAERFGDSIIRVHWQYAPNARQNPNLKKVCVWSDGDEGFVAI